VINKEKLREVAPLLAVMREISKKRGKTLPQIAINWTLCKGAIPIPGAKNTRQVFITSTLL
jgi:pyridoxine 4-dehydrogenase